MDREAINDLCDLVDIPKIKVFDIHPRKDGAVFFFVGPRGRDALIIKGADLVTSFTNKIRVSYPDIFQEEDMKKNGGKGFDSSDRAELKKMGKAAFVKHEKADIKAAQKKKKGK